MAHMSELPNTRCGKPVKVEHGIQQGCKAMGKPEKRHPVIQQSFLCTLISADM